MYINEQKATNVWDAAVLADEYVFTHNEYVHNMGPSGPGRQRDARSEGSGRPNGARQFEFNGAVARDCDRVCYHCQRRGHIKAECHLLKAKSRPFHANAKGAGLAAPVRKAVQQEVKSVGAEACDSYLPFICEGQVSLVGSDKKVRVKILRDTGAFDSFIRADVLPLSSESEMGRDACSGSWNGVKRALCSLA